MAEMGQLAEAPRAQTPATVPLSPEPLTRYRHRVRFRESMPELWRARTLVGRLAVRQLKSRYRRAILGFGWAIVTPVALTLTFTFILSRVIKVPTAGVPYPIFFYVGLLAWTFFANAIGTGSGSLLENMGLLKRAYVTREVFPLATIVVAVVDFATAAAVLLVMLPLFHFMPRITAFWVPLYLFVQVAFTTGVVLFTATAVVYVRDVRHIIPLGIQVGIFATPVVYGLSQVPERFRLLMVAVNPLAEVIDGYRRSLLYGQGPDWTYFSVSLATAVVVLVAGYWAFKRMEDGVADIS
ncbi:MAG: type transport system permease protein [Chloroflexota bacterium]|jgi:ABC-2 type transport system permease protein/lipopolysaccharide transport system permease protein|nr:type transport system permease protein [Chloroflexota bacterium]